MAQKCITFVVILMIIGIGIYMVAVERTSTLLVNTPSRAEIGISHQMRPITSYTFGQGPSHVVFVGGIHGGYEANTAQLGHRAVHYFQYEAVIPEEMTITVIPAANPDGLHKVVGTTGAFISIPQDTKLREAGRFNAEGVDLNRNFACAWQRESKWGTKTVSAGTHAFSEPETRALRDLVLEEEPDAVVFFHSKANGVYGSFCNDAMHAQTIPLVQAYAEASGYPAYEVFDAYPITGDAEGYLASIGIPAITVELETHEDMEWEKNQKGIDAVIKHLQDITTAL